MEALSYICLQSGYQNTIIVSILLVTYSYIIIQELKQNKTTTTTLPSKNTIFEDPVQRNLAGKGSMKNMLIVT